MADFYLYIKAFHLIAVISWLAGLLYLPRIFVYHSEVAVGSDMDKVFQTMERKLLRIIMNPAMIVAVGLGLLMIYISGMKAFEYWIHAKLFFVALLLFYHHRLAKMRKSFEKGENRHSSKYLRIFNEVPAILMVFIVLLVVVRPF